jgi:hypothetical protein
MGRNLGADGKKSASANLSSVGPASTKSDHPVKTTVSA